jgi:hypothetical protein
MPMLMLAAALMAGASAAAQQPPTAGQPPAGAQQPPGAPQPTPATPAAPQPRTFSAPAGLLFNTVRADRVADFEKVMGYLQAALEKSPSDTVREQAKGWRVFKATEPGPGGTVLYVYVVDPAVMGADYSLGRILADAYTDQAQLQQIWKLYTSSVTGGSLLNLTPLQVEPPKPTPKP